MNDSAFALDQFIKDFSLRQPDGIVYFFANINFLINNNMQMLDSDVHIVTSDNLAAIYILGLESKPWELPDMFTGAKDVFTYVNGECLRIEGRSGVNKYTLLIFPKQ